MLRIWCILTINRIKMPYNSINYFRIIIFLFKYYILLSEQTCTLWIYNSIQRINYCQKKQKKNETSQLRLAVHIIFLIYFKHEFSIVYFSYTYSFQITKWSNYIWLTFLNWINTKKKKCEFLPCHSMHISFLLILALDCKKKKWKKNFGS